MATIDVIIIAIILISTLFGMIRGMIASVLSLFGWILSFYLTFITFPVIEPYLQSKITNAYMLKIVGYSALLLIFLILFGILNVSLNIIMRPFSRNIFNRILGVLFGALRGVALVLVAMIAYTINIAMFHGIDLDETSTTKSMPASYQDAVVAPKFVQYSDSLKDKIPNYAENNLQSFYNRLTNSSSEERFVEYAILQLERVLSSDTRSEIRMQLHDARLKKPEEDILNLKLALKAFDKKSPEVQATTRLTDAELSKARKILARGRVNIDTLDTMVE